MISKRLLGVEMGKDAVSGTPAIVEGIVQTNWVFDKNFLTI